MKNRFLCLLLVGALLLGLTSCAPPPADTPSPSPSPEAEASPVPTPTPTPEPFAVQAADVPPGDYEPWQEGYIEYLNQRCAEEAPLIAWAKTATSEEVDADWEKWNAANTASYHYVLCDVDKDGVPELFIDQGSLSSPVYECYTFRDGEVTFLGELVETHASFYNWPGENALLVSWGKMFYWGYSKYSIVNGELVCQGILHDEELVDGEIVGHKEVEEVVPGATHVSCEYTRTIRDWDGKGVIAPLVLPICDYGVSSTWQNPAPMEESEVRSAIGRVLWEGAELVGVSGDGYTANVGTATMEEYLEKERIFTGSEEPLKVPRYAWADMNGDGQTDCVLFVGSTDIYGYTGTNYMILSVEDGTVYAYFYSCNLNGFAITSDGTVYFDCGFGEWGRESFYKNQCYRYPVPAPAEWDDLAWEPFPSEPPTP